MAIIAKKKAAGYWFKVNELVRNHSQMKTIINTNTDVQLILSQMNAIMVRIANQSGVTQFPGAANTTLQGNGFPVPKIVWMGELPYDIHSTDGKYTKVNLSEWRSKAQLLRDKVYGIIESVRLVGDILNVDSSLSVDPGGQV